MVTLCLFRLGSVPVIETSNNYRQRGNSSYLRLILLEVLDWIIIALFLLRYCFVTCKLNLKKKYRRRLILLEYHHPFRYYSILFIYVAYTNYFISLKHHLIKSYHFYWRTLLSDHVPVNLVFLPKNKKLLKLWKRNSEVGGYLAQLKRMVNVESKKELVTWRVIWQAI